MPENRWFVLPLTEQAAPYANAPGSETVPKHTDRDGITGWSGTAFHFDADTHRPLPFAGETMFVGKLYGSAAALDAVAAEPDAYAKAEYGLSDKTIAAYLNDRLDRDRSFGEWVRSFGLS